MATAPLLLNRDIDPVSAVLIAQLALDDINEFYRTTGQHAIGSTGIGGHGPTSGSTLSDEEYAFQLQAEDYRQILSAYNDYRLAAEPEQGVPLPEPIANVGADANAGFSGRNGAPLDGDLSQVADDDSDHGLDAAGSMLEQRGDDFLDPADLLVEPVRPPTRLSCVVCAEVVPPTSFKAACDHYFCTSCLEHYLATCIDNELMFPPRCCGQMLKLDRDDLPDLEPDSTSPTSSSSSLSSSLESIYGSVGLDLDRNLLTRFRKKSAEFQIIPSDRVYCPNPRCSRFLGSWDALKAPKPITSISQLISLHISGASSSLQALAGSSRAPKLLQSTSYTPNSTECPECHMTICLSCKDRAHPDRTTCQAARTEEDLMAEVQLRDLAKEKKWQTCPGCKEMVELNGGCNHVVCRCRREFCYTCGGDWPVAGRGGEEVCICR